MIPYGTLELEDDYLKMGRDVKEALSKAEFVLNLETMT